MSETGEAIRVLLADDHPALRTGIRVILECALDIQVVGEAEDGTTVRRLTADLHPQVLVLDLRMPGPPPAETVAWVRARCPETAVLVLTAHNRDDCLGGDGRSGGRGLRGQGRSARNHRGGRAGGGARRWASAGRV